MTRVGDADLDRAPTALVAYRCWAEAKGAALRHHRRIAMIS
jgi:hypothetical protein